ncbi:Na+/H+ antiporter subunit E [Neorhizobium sp. BETTINA12A]|jgi:multicomponent Na+:H+ antiporter subunit E|uniref:Na+/H+ antiporter subunit E n=1 Tax=unclassified Neorhizobium TaxID=2629175 RepID=UPI001FF513DE|nr:MULTISPECIES: Na+/H+ antiporter subunit E [unclassified Neorhizobium]MCJ9674669.1 Na+/H+ antiporter subunit E [Neorhizobium sp. SHOUNA12B]MCJ9748625.1 Na+/H+ antiporter subunit E [Neorhizobium sp. SHOUNA12A]MCJ9754816.1 Na+/H+ antiporter subunit E [Neorhizobium sp. BETTINA12A]
MITYILSLVFAVVWVTVTGSATLQNLIFGFVLSTLALWIVRDEMGARGYWRRLGRILSLLALFLKELALSAWKVAVLVMSPRMDLKPGIFAFPLTVTRDFEITLLANLITLTPGTLSVDVSEDRKTLFVHAIDCSDVEATKRDIANGFERKIMEAFR